MRVFGAGFAATVVLGGIWACSSFTTAPAAGTTSDAGADGAFASIDAAAPTMTDAGPFCQSRPELLCVDFEVAGLYGGDWATNNDTTMGQGSLVRDATMGKDSVASLRSTLPTGDGETGAFVELGTDTTTTSAYLEADIYVKRPAGSFGAQLTVLAIQRGPDGSATDVEANILWVDDGTYQLVLYAETSNAPDANATASPGVVPFDTWVHLRLESDLKGTGQGGARITVNGAAAAAVALNRRDEPVTEHTRAVLGLYRFKDKTTSPDVELFIDNVVSGPLTP